MICLDQELSTEKRRQLLELLKNRGYVGYYVSDVGFCRIGGGSVSDEEFGVVIQGKVPPHEIAWIVSA